MSVRGGRTFTGQGSTAPPMYTICLYILYISIYVNMNISIYLECVPDAKSRDQLGRRTDTDLFNYFKKKYGDETSTSFKEQTES